MRKKVLSMILSIMLTMSLLTACGSNQTSVSDSETSQTNEESDGDKTKKFRIGLSNLADSDESCFNACNTMAEIVESDEFAEKAGANVTVEWVDSDSNIDKQTSNVEALLTKGIDAMFIIGVDTAGNSAAVKACNDAGAPVFMVATESEEGDYKFVGFNEYDTGYAQGKYLVDNAEKGAGICYIEGAAGREATLLREEGFLAALEEREDLKLLASQNVDWTAEGAMQVTEDWIQAYGTDIDWIVTQDNKMAQGAIEVLKAADMTDQVKINGWIVSGTWDVDLMAEGFVEYAVYVSFGVLGEKMADVCQTFYTEGYDSIEAASYMEIFDVTPDNLKDYFDVETSK